MSQVNRGGLILPHSAVAQRQPVSPAPPPPSLPEALAAEVKGHLDAARDLDDRLRSLMDAGEAGLIALSQQPAVLELLQIHQRRILPSLIAEICRRDRTMVSQVFHQVLGEEVARRSMQDPLSSAVSAPDLVGYQKAVGDLHEILRRLGFPALEIQVQVAPPDPVPS